MRNKYLHQQAFWMFLFAWFPTVSAQIAQVTPSADPRIDTAKPIAYLVFDHIGPRNPIEPGEGTTGIYLRIQNNSRLPLVIAVLKDHKNAPVPSLLDEVIPNRKLVLGAGLPWMPSPGFPTVRGWDDLQAYPNEDEEAVRAAEFDAERGCKNPDKGKLAARPNGYGWDLAPALTIIPPGGALLFSLPANHASREWHIEIPFRLGLANDGKERPPYSYLAFFWEDIPEAYRLARSSTSSQSTPPASTLRHESSQADHPKPQ